MTNLRLMTWNVHGLNDNMMNDAMFNSVLDDSDIIVLTETWLDKEVSIRSKEFFNYHQFRPKSVRAKRPSGGVSILLHHRLRSRRKLKQ